MCDDFNDCVATALAFFVAAAGWLVFGIWVWFDRLL
jgi:hypothetical protein